MPHVFSSTRPKEIFAALRQVLRRAKRRLKKVSEGGLDFASHKLECADLRKHFSVDEARRSMRDVHAGGARDGSDEPAFALRRAGARRDFRRELTLPATRASFHRLLGGASSVLGGRAGCAWEEADPHPVSATPVMAISDAFRPRTRDGAEEPAWRRRLAVPFRRVAMATRQRLRATPDRTAANLAGRRQGACGSHRPQEAKRLAGVPGGRKKKGSRGRTAIACPSRLPGADDALSGLRLPAVRRNRPARAGR